MDYVGLGLLVVWVGALQIMLDRGKDLEWFSSGLIVAFAIIAAALMFTACNKKDGSSVSSGGGTSSQSMLTMKGAAR